MKKLPYITRLKNENEALKTQLANLQYVPGLTNIDWTREDANWLANIFANDHGKKLRALLNNIERHLSFWALHEPDPVKAEHHRRKAVGMSLALNYLHYWANTGREIKGVDKVESDMLVRGPGEITPDELEKRLSEMAKSPRMGSSRMMSL